MHIVLPETSEGIPEFYQGHNRHQGHILMIFNAFVQVKKYDFAECFIRLACEEYSARFWPLVNLLYVLALQDQKIEGMKVAARILKNARLFTAEDENSHVVLGIYDVVKTALLAGDVKAVSVLCDLAMRIHPYGKRLVSNAGEFAPLSYEEFREKIIDRSAQFDKGEISQPRIIQNIQKINLKEISAFKGKKVLCVFRQHAYTTGNSREVEFFDFYQRTALEAGLDYKAFASNTLIHVGSASEEEFKQELVRLEDIIAQWMPDYIYVDNFFAVKDSSLVPFFHGEIARMKSQYGFKLIGFYADSWSIEQQVLIDLGIDLMDAFHHGHSTYEATSPEHERKNFCFPCPYPKALFDWPEVKKDVFCGFLGSLHNIRAPWLAQIQEDDLNVASRFSSNENSGELVSTQAYAKELTRYEVSMIFSTRTPYQTAMTGTVWEAIITRSLVFEEESKEAHEYLVPFVHYIPFISYAHVKYYLEYLEKDQELVQLIQKNATTLFEKNYKSENFWSGLLSLVDENAQ